MDSIVKDLYFRAVAIIERQETPYAVPPLGLWVDFLRFPPGLWTWRSGGTPDCLLMACTGGRGILRHRHGEIAAVRGDVLLLMPQAPHDYGALNDQPWDVRYAHFPPGPALSEHLRWPEAAPGIRHLTLAEGALREVDAALARGRSRLHASTPLAHALAANAVEEAVVLCDQSNPERGAYDSRVRLAVDFVCAHLQRPLRLAEVADAAGLSVSRLARLFHRQTGSTIRSFLERRRLELARQRLSLTDEPIQRIADDLGFTSAFYFSRRFRHFMGTSPSVYRERAR